MAMEVSMPSKTRWIVFSLSLAAAIIILWIYPSQITSLDPIVAANQLGERALAKGNYLEAAQMLARSASEYPNDANLRYHLAQAYAGLHDMPKAVTQYTAALTIDNYHAPSLRDLGIYYIQTGQIESAEALLPRLDKLCSQGKSCAERNGLAGSIAKAKAVEQMKKK